MVSIEVRARRAGAGWGGAGEQAAAHSPFFQRFAKGRVPLAQALRSIKAAVQKLSRPLAGQTGGRATPSAPRCRQGLGVVRSTMGWGRHRLCPPLGLGSPGAPESVDLTSG